MRFIGEYYREKILSLRPRELQKRELPPHADDIRILPGLFGWNLYAGKEAMECRSENEARYLQVMINYGYREVMVPKSDEYLKQIVPELERLHKKTMGIIDSFMRSLLNRQAREKLRQEVFAEITK